MSGAGSPGSKSSSSSASTNTTNTSTKNVDMRIAADAGAISSSAYIEASGSTVTVLDDGAIHSAFGFAREVAADAFEMATASQVNTNQTITDAMEGVADAYVDAKQGEQKILTAVGLAVVAIVAVQVVKGK
jgi:hypothetical protein